MFCISFVISENLSFQSSFFEAVLAAGEDHAVSCSCDTCEAEDVADSCFESSKPRCRPAFLGKGTQQMKVAWVSFCMKQHFMAGLEVHADAWIKIDQARFTSQFQVLTVSLHSSGQSGS